MNCLEIGITPKSDAFQIQAYLLKLKGVKKVYIVTCQMVRVFFDPLKISDKIIVKSVGHVGKKSSRVKRVSSVRELPCEPEIN